MASVVTLLGRGLAAGGVSGVVAGGFAYLLAEPVIGKLIDIESARSAAAGETGEETFTRGEQRFGLLVALFAEGLAFGILFALVYALVHKAEPSSEPWRRSLRLAGAGFLGVWLIPFIRYPAAPPGVGDGDTVGLRSDAWLGAIVLGLVAVAGAMLLHSWLAAKGSPEPVRHLVTAAVPVVALALSFLVLPDNPDAMEIPPNLLWDFRAVSAGANLLLWAGIGIVMGLLGLRAAKKARTAQPA
ncbi:CbtA family protein [Longispora albida]|uniref:CbtA family protein n=1 Tax=Longispora albida TaxID=203523 RepID=UPI000377365F|nr:CbtA family protein [Longispora albida]